MATKKKAEDPPPAGAPMWIVTFTDMISLLLTFFILMLTFSSSETEKFQQLAGSLNGSFGIVEDKRPIKQDKVSNIGVTNRQKAVEGATQPDLRDDPVNEAVDKVQNLSIYNTQIDTRDMTEGTRIRLDPDKDEEFFELGTGVLTPSGRKLLEEVGILFRSLPCRLVIETHVDSLTWQASGKSSAIDLTLDMGVSAALTLEQAGCVPERIGLSPIGDAVPIAGNETAEKRYRNRRIEILVIPDTKDELLASESSGAN